MIEVEGNINDQPISILIESRASHSYLDPKMVERFHFPRSNLGKTVVGAISYRRKKEN
jgi:hypothetical protein